MRFSILIPAMAVLGLAGCQVPAPTTDGTPVRVTAPATTPAVAPAAAGIAEPEIVAPTTETAAAEPEEAVVADSQAEMSEEPAELPATEPAAETVPELASEPAAEDDTTETQTEMPAAETTEMAAVPTPEETQETPAESNPAVAPVADDMTAAEGNVSDLGGDMPASDDNPEVDVALAAPPPPPPPPPPPELDPDTLIGSDEEALRRRLGEADFQRREGDMETRQYRLPACVVDYFLFPRDDGPQIVAWAWRTPVIGGVVDGVACRRALAEREMAG